MGSAAYKAQIKIAGDPVRVVKTAFSRVGNTATYKANNAAHTIISPDFRVIVYRAGDFSDTIITPLEYSVNYLLGEITFYAVPPATTQISVTYNYVPTATTVGASSYGVNLSGDILDDTNFKDADANGGYRTRLYGINDVSISLSRFNDNSAVFKTLKEKRKRVLVEIRPGGTELVRGWFVIESDNTSGDVGGLETEEISLQLDGDTTNNFIWR